MKWKSPQTVGVNLLSVYGGDLHKYSVNRNPLPIYWRSLLPHDFYIYTDIYTHQTPIKRLSITPSSRKNDMSHVADTHQSCNFGHFRKISIRYTNWQSSADSGILRQTWADSYTLRQTSGTLYKISAVPISYVKARQIPVLYVKYRQSTVPYVKPRQIPVFYIKHRQNPVPPG